MPKHSDGQSAPADVAFPVVGLGASAGGVTALQQFFEALPATTGAAYVVVSHLSPEHPSSLDELLQQATSMPVTQISADTPLEPDRVYVCAPSCAVELIRSGIVVTPAKDTRAVMTAIDVLFRSLAEAHRERAVGIVLSGAGSDGSVGIKRIKELGGTTMAQCPDHAEHASMPRAAIETGTVDFVLTVSDMPQRLLDLWLYAERIRLPEALVAAEGDPQSGAADLLSSRNERALREIMIVLRTRTGQDFRHYKRTSILRRIERRMPINGLTNLEQYRDFLHLYPEETQALLHDILASATSFFRDRLAYEALRNDILPDLFAQRSADEPVRIWAAGCATGEEAYSLAMLLQEASSATAGPVPFQVFATDIDPRAIDIARQGAYSDAILADVDEQRLMKSFVNTGAGYRVKKELRERILFAVHNVLRDPPFSRLDLICCRNLLVHLDARAQTDVLRAFDFALRSRGYLFIGAAETIDAAGKLFSVVDKNARVFRCTGSATADSAAHPEFAVPATALSSAPTLSALQSAGKRRLSFGDLHGRLIEEYAFPSVLVNRNSEIVHVSDRAGRFLQFAGGEPSHNVFAAIRPEFRAELRTTIYQALNTQNRIDARPVRVEHGGRAFDVRMIAQPLHDDEVNDDFVLILFDERQIAPSKEQEAHDEPAEGHHVELVAQLEQELQSMRDKQQHMVEQYETLIEELRSSNEELSATNDELRAAAEALEANREDLQAANEALTSINGELKTKVNQTTKINDDLQNLITISETGTIFIDRRLTIMRFTPRTKEVFNLVESDIGRSLLDVTHRLQYDQLEADATEALSTLRLLEREIRGADGRWYLARFLPYRATGDVIEGAVLSFVDITSRRLAEERLNSASQPALEEMKRRQDEFLAVVSHELKHPLNLISANAEIIARSPWARREPGLAHAANTISRTVAGQAQIIDDLLDISRVRTGKLSLDCAPVDLAEAVRRICCTVRDEARRSAIELAVSVPDHPVTIEADITRIEQIIWNLIDNALKYTNRDGKITVTLATDEGFAKLTVSDNGIGIDPTVFPYIFEMFQRGQTKGFERSGGLGIGLSLVKELVAVHGGRVSVKSDGLGKGSTFTVELPCLLGQANVERNGGHPPVFLRDIEVVLVDDDRDTVEAFKLLLETEGANVIVATAGDEALRILEKRAPSFILSDLGMPGMSGVQLIEAVRKRNRLAKVKAIALSGFGRDADVQAALRAGFDAHLTKPVTLDALLDTMARLRAR